MLYKVLYMCFFSSLKNPYDVGTITVIPSYTGEKPRWRSGGVLKDTELTRT